MGEPLDYLDKDERAALAGLETEFEALRARHAEDPHVDALRAARHELLPTELQAETARRLEASRWSQALVDGLDEASDSAALDGDDESRLLQRIKRDTVGPPRRGLAWLWPAIATAAVTLAAIGWVWRGGTQAPAPDVSPLPPVVAEAPRPAPVYALALEKPTIRLSTAAMTWRGAGGRGDLLADLKGPLDAFRAGDYQSAERGFGELTGRYPKAVEVFYYQGVSRLFLNDASGALQSLATARSLADDAFAPEVAWYTAVAQERTGHIDAVRAGLTGLCAQTNARAASACAALRMLK